MENQFKNVGLNIKYFSEVKEGEEIKISFKTNRYTQKFLKEIAKQNNIDLNNENDQERLINHIIYTYGVQVNYIMDLEKTIENKEINE